MKRIAFPILALIMLLAWPAAFPAHAASKYKACSLLTAAELEAVVRIKVAAPESVDVPVTEGPFKGETVSICSWGMGSTAGAAGYIMLSVMRAPKNAHERAAGLAMLREADEQLKKQGWTIKSVTIGGVECATYQPPAGGNLPAGAGCAVEAKGVAFSLSIVGATAAVTPQQVKALADRAVARLP